MNDINEIVVNTLLQMKKQFELSSCFRKRL